jgi:hypothetical protein
MGYQDLWDQSCEPEQLRAVIDADGGCCWEVCAGGVCLQGRDRAELMRRWGLVRQDWKGPSPAALTVKESQ